MSALTVSADHLTRALHAAMLFARAELGLGNVICLELDGPPSARALRLVAGGPYTCIAVTIPATGGEEPWPEHVGIRHRAAMNVAFVTGNHADAPTTLTPTPAGFLEVRARGTAIDAELEDARDLHGYHPLRKLERWRETFPPGALEPRAEHTTGLRPVTVAPALLEAAATAAKVLFGPHAVGLDLSASYRPLVLRAHDRPGGPTLAVALATMRRPGEER